MKQEMMGWQWHQLDHVQIIYTSLQSDKHVLFLIMCTETRGGFIGAPCTCV